MYLENVCARAWYVYVHVVFCSGFSEPLRAVISCLSLVLENSHLFYLQLFLLLCFLFFALAFSFLLLEFQSPTYLIIQYHFVVLKCCILFFLYVSFWVVLMTYLQVY